MNAGEEVALLLAAVREAVERTSIRAVAKESGVSHGGIYNFVNGRTGRLYGTTIGKLRNWYLRQWASADGDGLTPHVAAYLVEQMLAVVPSGGRNEAALELVHALEGIYERRGARRPVWLSTVRDEYGSRRAPG